MTHSQIPALHKSFVFRWFQDWANENITWEVGTKYDRYDQLMYVADRAAKWGAEQALLKFASEKNTNA